VNKSAVFLIKILLAGALLQSNMSSYGATVIAASVLPLSTYTRITIESDQVISRSILVLKNPDRVVLDLKNTPINQSLKSLIDKVLPEDFYIKQVRVANFKQGVTRIVVDLKAEAKPKLSVYQPAGEYQHRLALDIYPMQDAIKTDEVNDVSEAPAENKKTKHATTSSSGSSGAKIILDTEPAYEPEDDLDL